MLSDLSRRQILLWHEIMRGPNDSKCAIHLGAYSTITRKRVRYVKYGLPLSRENFGQGVVSQSRGLRRAACSIHNSTHSRFLDG